MQTGLRQVKVFVNTSRNTKEEYNVGVIHSIQEIYVTQSIGGSKSGYMLVYGDNQFSTFEIGEGLLPVTLDTFVLDKKEYHVNDICLFGKYIIAAVDGKVVPTEQEYNKAEVLKLTFAGKVYQTMPINYSLQDDKIKSQAEKTRITKLILVNQHLMMVSPTGFLYYADIKGF